MKVLLFPVLGSLLEEILPPISMNYSHHTIIILAINQVTSKTWRSFTKKPTIVHLSKNDFATHFKANFSFQSCIPVVLFGFHGFMFYDSMINNLVPLPLQTICKIFHMVAADNSTDPSIGKKEAPVAIMIDRLQHSMNF